MRIKKSSWIISLTILLVSLLLTIIQKDFSLTALSDNLFLFTLFFLIVGGFLWVFSSGFFDNFQRSFKRRNKKTKTAGMKLSEVGRSSFRFWLEPAGILFLLSLLTLLLAIF
ncbi:DUF3899 domain-containing protein [Tetragenococcus koreensis]|uniref:DUF3899 domain-containing protein n=1 Tax=Tetragenococcus koreensis TaxID=290335 RepID=UPI000F4D3896|nr:DUF3899 domain-containing protein [Tetragenococcus koreensis]AYW45734.1 DUF3899 domain-containing protein [Tetragenococcus koreensis]MCF1585893.1 DUF3899 domain-containing protein [Tetragenococcus koreensis]MCF1615475.1 DUF3899 domain-containing protein [Tetragenococcus koreensis]MCF1616920.1 DUF3899 domain-containing protein [Tetragenococcus koreensis]MCF1620507.1 DUF3899 domain-containing protein [Tetragenococcus koreensis]